MVFVLKSSVKWLLRGFSTGWRAVSEFEHWIETESLNTPVLA